MSTTRRQFLQDLTAGGAARWRPTNRAVSAPGRRVCLAIAHRPRGLHGSRSARDGPKARSRSRADWLHGIKPLQQHGAEGFPRDARPTQADDAQHPLAARAKASARKMLGFQVWASNTRISRAGRVAARRRSPGGAGPPRQAARGRRRPASLPPGACCDAAPASSTRLHGDRGVRAVSAARVARLIEAPGNHSTRTEDRAEVRHEDAHHNHTGNSKLTDSRTPTTSCSRRPIRRSSRCGSISAGRHRRRRSDCVVQGAPRPLRALARQRCLRPEDRESVAQPERARQQHGARARRHGPHRLEAGLRAGAARRPQAFLH